MNRYCKCACVLILTAGLSGCSTEANKSLVDAVGVLFDLGCTAARELVPVPQAVPPVLSVVRNDPARFAPVDHPLKGVSVGTVIDDLSGLDGCWGRFVIDSIENPETGEVFEQERMEVLVFDLAAGRVTQNSFSTRPPLSFSLSADSGFADSFFGETPFFLTAVSRVEIIRDNMITINGISSEGAAIEADGRFVFDCGVALGGSFSDTASLTGLVTLQGDFLKKDDDLGGPEDALANANDEFAELWVRFDCAEQ